MFIVQCDTKTQTHCYYSGYWKGQCNTSQSDLYQQMLKEILAFTYDLGTSSTDEGEESRWVFTCMFTSSALQSHSGGLSRETGELQLRPPAVKIIFNANAGRKVKRHFLFFFKKEIKWIGVCTIYFFITLILNKEFHCFSQKDCPPVYKYL